MSVFKGPSLNSIDFAVLDDQAQARIQVCSGKPEHKQVNWRTSLRGVWTWRAWWCFCLIWNKKWISKPPSFCNKGSNNNHPSTWSCSWLGPDVVLHFHLVLHVHVDRNLVLNTGQPFQSSQHPNQQELPFQVYAHIIYAFLCIYYTCTDLSLFN